MSYVPVLSVTNGVVTVIELKVPVMKSNWLMDSPQTELKL